MTMGTIRRYICEAMKRAEYKRMEDGQFFAPFQNSKGCGQLVQPWRRLATTLRLRWKAG